MEFMFHSTCMYNQDAKFFLITEAMRGEGAKLLLPNGESLRTNMTIEVSLLQEIL